MSDGNGRGDAPADPSGPSDPADMSASRTPPGSSGRLGRARLLPVALITALASALAGGLVGGYVGSRSATGTLLRDSLGTVPPALANRPPDSVAGIAARVRPGVVMIKVNGAEGTGSGFIIRGGYIVTDDHVVTLDGVVAHASLQVVFNGGLTEPARLVGADPFSDIAVIRPQRPAGPRGRACAPAT